jgi:hypothetical protein
MPKQTSKITKLDQLKEKIEIAETAIREAKELTKEISGDKKILVQVKANLKAVPKQETTEAPQSVVEGVFDGESMIADDGKKYPVPANYASKSKLVEGDLLKLTVAKNGAFVYKQIGPVERKMLRGVLAEDNGQYHVFAEGRDYRVILASVTYFRAKTGDEVTIVVPGSGDSAWAAIENVIYKS